MRDARSIVGSPGHFHWRFDEYGPTAGQWNQRRSIKYHDALTPDHRRKSGLRFTDIGFGELESGMMPGCDKPGVYAIIAYSITHPTRDGRVLPIHEHLLYIGSGVNVKRRLSGNHHIYDKFFMLGGYQCMVRILFTADYLEEEKRLIRELKPVFNIQHKDGKAIH